MFALGNVWLAAQSTEWQRAQTAARRAGYGVALWQLDAAKLGVPQRRKRCYLVGVLNADAPRPPTAVAESSAGAALAKLGETGSTSDRLHAPFAAPAADIVERARAAVEAERAGMRRGDENDRRHWVLRENRRASTLTAQSRPLHWSMRYLTAREVARLQQFPDSYDWGRTSTTKVRSLLGTATPVGMAHAIARQLSSAVVRAGLQKIIAGGGERYVLGVALEPSDDLDAAAIRREAHRFTADVQRFRAQGRDATKRVRVLESWLAPHDIELNGQTVPNGSWLLGLRIVDDELWAVVLGGSVCGYEVSS